MGSRRWIRQYQTDPCFHRGLAGKISGPFRCRKSIRSERSTFHRPFGYRKDAYGKALAGETGINFISVSGPILFSKWLGESEKALHQIFKKAKQSAPCILFFDEIDALIPTRVLRAVRATERVASQFFTEFDKLTDHSQVVVLGATNREDLLDPP